MSKISVTSAEFQQNFGRYREVAIHEPVTITVHGRDSLVLLSAEEYQRILRGDREALYVSELSDEDVQAMLAADIPEGSAAFDHEVSP